MKSVKFMSFSCIHRSSIIEFWHWADHFVWKLSLIFIHKNPTRYNILSTFIIPYLYEAQHVSGDTPPIIRSLKLYWQPLVLHMWKVVGRVVAGRCHAEPDSVQQPHVQQPSTYANQRLLVQFRLLMMGGVSSETCWASYKYGIIKFWYTVASCWIFFFFFY
jgi:hypothetical protein